MLSWAKATNSGYNYQNKTVSLYCSCCHSVELLWLTVLTSWLLLQFFSLSPSEVGLVLELLDSRIPELSLTHSPNMNASEEDKNTKSLHITRASGSDGNPLVKIKVNHESESVATLNVGEARVFRVREHYST